MSFSATLRVLVFAFVIIGAKASSAADEWQTPEIPQRSTARNNYFEVLADDAVSAQFAASTGELLAQRVLRIVPLPQGTNPVFVDLVPFSRFEGSSGFETQIYRSGQVRVTVAWGETTTRALMERALAQGFLTAMARAYSQDGIAVPLWLELAVQHMARVSTVSSHRWALAERVRDEKPMRLREILTAQRGEGSDDELGPNPFLLMRFLETEAQGRGQLQSFMVRLFRGEDSLAALGAAFGGPLRSIDDAELWWLVGRSEMLRSSGSPMWSAERSRDRLQELARLTFFLEGEKIRLFADELWEHWQSGSLYEELEYRTRVIHVENGFFHVFYRNALLSLNRLFETVLAGDEEAYLQARLVFQQDLQTGNELAEDVGNVLDELQAELKIGKD